LLIAAPALLLALLGLRAVGAERIEREQQAREQQTQLSRLANNEFATIETPRQDVGFENFVRR
jgi:Tfp pilus assembly protein PilV